MLLMYRSDVWKSVGSLVVASVSSLSVMIYPKFDTLLVLQMFLYVNVDYFENSIAWL